MAYLIVRHTNAKLYLLDDTHKGPTTADLAVWTEDRSKAKRYPDNPDRQDDDPTLPSGGRWARMSKPSERR